MKKHLIRLFTVSAVVSLIAAFLLSMDKVESYNKQNDNINNMIKNLKTYVDELKTISSNYAQTESAIVTATNELPSNILE